MSWRDAVLAGASVPLGGKLTTVGGAVLAGEDVPVTLLTGWYDSYTRSTTDMYVALSTMKRGPVRLIVGPWVQGVGTMQQSWNGDVDFGQD